MAKKKTENKELKVEAPTKKEAVKVEIPNTKMVKIVLNGQEHLVGYDLAKVLIDAKRAKLA
jgi:hypothetical protein